MRSAPPSLSFEFARPPQVNLSQAMLVVLLLLCIALAGYSFYRIRRGRSLRGSIRKKYRRLRKNGRAL